jgi:hypothetical protein
MSAHNTGQPLKHRAWKALTWPIRWTASAARATLSDWLRWMTSKAAKAGASLGHTVLTALALAAVTVVGTLLFIGLPDIDLALLPVLHHRSIITHSVLPALLLLRLRTAAGRAFAIGGLVGVAVHLSADLLSPMVGFGQIWLPWPIKMPLGPLSYLWLAANAALASIVAVRLASKGSTPTACISSTIIYSFVTATIYGVVNEGSWVASMTAIGIIAAGATLELRYLNRVP